MLLLLFLLQDEYDTDPRDYFSLSYWVMDLVHRFHDLGMDLGLPAGQAVGVRAQRHATQNGFCCIALQCSLASSRFSVQFIWMSKFLLQLPEQAC